MFLANVVDGVSVVVDSERISVVGLIVVESGAVVVVVDVVEVVVEVESIGSLLLDPVESGELSVEGSVSTFFSMLLEENSVVVDGNDSVVVSSFLFDGPALRMLSM